MSLNHPGFFERREAVALNAICEAISADLGTKAGGDVMISGVAALDVATAGDLSFFDNRKYRDLLTSTTAVACLVRPSDAGAVPETVLPVVSRDPYRAFAAALAWFYPGAMRGAPIYEPAEAGEAKCRTRWTACTSHGPLGKRRHC